MNGFSPDFTIFVRLLSIFFLSECVGMRKKYLNFAKMSTLSAFYHCNCDVYGEGDKIGEAVVKHINWEYCHRVFDTNSLYSFRYIILELNGEKYSEKEKESQTPNEASLRF